MGPQLTQTQAITPDRARQWAGKFVDAWNSHDPERVLDLVTEDVLWEAPFIPGGSLRGKAALREYVLSIWRAVPDLRAELIGEPFISLDGTRLAAAWKDVGHFTGPLDPPGFAATNGAIEITGVDIHEFDGELLKRIQSQTDGIALGRQIGASPPEGSRGERVGVLMQRLAARRMRAKAK